MKILYVTQYFPPEIGAPQVRIPELMRQLIGHGHRVTVLTAMPNYPTGRVFPGYRWRCLMTEPYEEMRVVRTWIYPTLSVGFLRRTASQLSFATSGALLGRWAVGPQDVILVGSPPLFIALTAQVLRRALRCPYLAVVADLWPQIAIETGMLKSRSGIRLARGLERMLYRNAAGVLTQTPGQASDIRERFPEVRAEVLSGGVDTTLFSPAFRSEEVRRMFGVGPGEVGVVFAGLHGFAQGLDVVLDAAGLLRDRPGIRWVLVGSGTEKAALQRRAAALGLEDLRFFDPVPRERMPALLASMDIALVPLRRGVPRATLPSKLYEIMASALPVAVSADGEAADLVRVERIGEAAGAGDAAGLAEAVERLAADAEGRRACGIRALQLARTRYDRRAIGRHLHDLLMEIVGTS